jgi:flagellar FliL protein
MADEEKKEEATEEPKKGGGKGLMIGVIVGALILAGGGVAATYLLAGGKDKGKSSKPAKSESDDFEGSDEKMGPMLTLKSFIVNLNEPGGARYLKLSIQLELRGKPLSETETPMQVRVRDKILVFLSGLKLRDVQDPKKKVALKKQIKKMANEGFRSRRVRRVYFKDFVVQ